jgi:cytochrome c peroxidase
MNKKIAIVAFLFAGVFTIAIFASFLPNDNAVTHSSRRERKIQKEVLNRITSFRDYVRDSLLLQVNKDHADDQSVQRAFLKSRLRFKKFQWAAEYFTADLAKRLNGPPVQEIENADLLDPSLARAVHPMGLQVIEPFIYRGYDTARRKELISHVSHLITNTEYLMSWFANHELADWRILDACKLEVFRINALGLTGFDCALSLNSMEESSASLASLRDVLSFYTDKKKETSLLADLNAAMEYLHRKVDFDSFDRAAFITRFTNKISSAIAGLQQALPSPGIKYNRMLRQDARTLFDSGAFNTDAFSPGPEFHTTDPKVALGKKLFYDASLSGTGTRSCASCHNPDLAFTDGKPKHTDIHDPETLLGRNVPTLLNAALQSNYFYDMRALTLEDQVRDVINSEQEMDGSMDAIIKYVSADESYRSLFEKTFPAATENGIGSDEVANALASYIRSLTKLDSRFDEYMRGDEAALSKQELRGFDLFMGKAKCATCHFVPLFNGVTPPKYVESETEVLGVPLSMADSTVDPDPGYYSVIGVDSYKHAFKVPTLRNISKTSPYMHNGIYQSLEEVMEFYNNGGAAGLGIHLPNQTLSEEKLHLTENEKKDVIAFMESLDSK